MDKFSLLSHFQVLHPQLWFSPLVHWKNWSISFCISVKSAVLLAISIHSGILSGNTVYVSQVFGLDRFSSLQHFSVSTVVIMHMDSHGFLGSLLSPCSSWAISSSSYFTKEQIYFSFKKKSTIYSLFRGGDHIQALGIQRMTSFNCFSTFRWVLESELRSSGLYYLGMAKTYPLSLARSLPLNRPPIPRLPWKDSRSSSLPSVLWCIFFLCSKQFGFPLSLPVWTNFAQVLCDFHHSGFSFITALYQNDSWSLVLIAMTFIPSSTICSFTPPPIWCCTDDWACTTD